MLPYDRGVAKTWFRISFALKAFERLLAARGVDSATMGVAEGLDTMIEFYVAHRAQHTRLEDDDDGLLFQWAPRDDGLEIGLTRQLCRHGTATLHQLSVSFVVATDAAPPAAGNQWFFDPADPVLSAQIRDSPAWAAATTANVTRRQVGYSPV
jgi:hypothetical protein